MVIRSFAVCADKSTVQLIQRTTVHVRMKRCTVEHLTFTR